MKLNDVKLGPRQTGPGLVPVLRALVADDAQFDVDSLAPGVVDRALENGLGAILARVSREATANRSVHADAIQAADLTARLLTADVLETVAHILRTARDAGCELVLLKGCSTGVRYYPEPHLRTMGDVDVLVAASDWPRVEALMRADGFVDTNATLPASWYERHHHSIPLWQPQRQVWLELHTLLYPPFSPLAAHPRFLPAAIDALITTTAVAGGPARVFAHELQLVYTATRWADMPSFQRGAFPILDAAMLIALHRTTVNWDQVCALVDGTWAATALRLMLTYLDRWELAAVPPPVIRELARKDRFANGALLDLLHRLITAFVMEGRPLGRILTSRTWRTTWSTLVGPTSAWTKPLRLPVRIALPPRDAGRSGRERD